MGKVRFCLFALLGSACGGAALDEGNGAGGAAGGGGSAEAGAAGKSSGGTSGTSNGTGGNPAGAGAGAGHGGAGAGRGGASGSGGDAGAPTTEPNDCPATKPTDGEACSVNEVCSYALNQCLCEVSDLECIPLDPSCPEMLQQRRAGEAPCAPPDCTSRRIGAGPYYACTCDGTWSCASLPRPG